MAPGPIGDKAVAGVIQSWKDQLHPWCKMGLSGEWIDTRNPLNTPIHIETVAGVLAKIPRFHGHVPVFYSVAQHCMHVSRLLEPRYGKAGALFGLLHDAHEAYCGDVGSPVKEMFRVELGDWFDHLERTWEIHVRASLDCPSETPELVEACKEADREALLAEASQFIECRARGLEENESPTLIARMYLGRYQELTR